MKQLPLLMLPVLLLVSSAHAERQASAFTSLEQAFVKGTAHWVCRCICNPGPALDNFDLDAPGKCDGSENGTNCENSDGSILGTLESCHNVLVEDE